MSSQTGKLDEDEELILLSLSEAVLANYIALRSAGIPSDDVKIVVGPDGGTVIGSGIVLQTPVTQRLSDSVGHRFHEAFQQLYVDFETGKLDPGRISSIMEQHHVADKVQAIVARGVGGEPTA